MYSNYIVTTKAKSNNSKYSRWYFDIISRAVDRQKFIPKCGAEKARKLSVKIGTYVERHHILPKSMCDDIEQKKDFYNQVFLTAREHIVCHLLLSRMFSGKDREKMQYACIAFTRQRKTQKSEYTKVNSRTYSLLKTAYSSFARSRSGKNNPLFGKSLSEEAKEKLRKPKSNSDLMGRYIRSEDTLKKLKENRTGKCRGENNAMASKENREKVGNSKVGRKRFYNKNTGQKIYQYPEKIDKNVWCSPEEYKKLK